MQTASDTFWPAEWEAAARAEKCRAPDDDEDEDGDDDDDEEDDDDDDHDDHLPPSVASTLLKHSRQTGSVSAPGPTAAALKSASIRINQHQPASIGINQHQ